MNMLQKVKCLDFDAEKLSWLQTIRITAEQRGSLRCYSTKALCKGSIAGLQKSVRL